MSAQTAKNVQATKKDAGLTIISPEALACYAYVWKARPSLNPGQGDQFSIVLLFDKKADLSKLRSVAKLAASRKWGSEIPKGLKNPFRDGTADRPDDPLFRGKTFITARTNQKPGIVDRQAQPILDETEFYSGCKCRASLYAMAYDQKGQRGVTFLLNNIQKLSDGERLSGRRSAEEEFEALDGEEAGDEADDGDMFE